MPPPNFFDGHEDLSVKTDKSEDTEAASLTEMAFWYMIVLIAMLLLWLVLFFCLRIIALRQKTRRPQQRRMYTGTRPRQSLPQEPTIFVSPSNLPPPPKYEFMAPPSYEEVVGVHYPQFAAQPISQPISAALTQGSSNAPTLTIADNTTDTQNNPPASITVTTEVRRTSVPAART